MTIKFDKKWFSQIMLYFAWTIYALSYGILKISTIGMRFSISGIYILCQYSCIILLFFSLIFRNKLNIRTLILETLVIFIFFIITLLNRNLFFLVFLFIIDAIEIDSKKFIRFDLKLKIFNIILIVGLCVAGVINSYSADINGTYKQSFGFGHPNTFCLLVFTALLEYLYIQSSISIPKLSVCLLISFLTFAKGGSRTTSYTFGCILLILLIFYLKPKLMHSKIVVFIFTTAPLLFSSLCYIMLRLYEQRKSFAVKIDTIITGRLHMGEYFFNNYSVKLFGQTLKTVSTEESETNGIAALILDCAYYRSILQYGLIFSILLIVFYFVFVYNNFQRHDVMMNVIVMFFAAVGIAENAALIPFYNISLLFLIRWIRPETTLEKIQCFCKKIHVKLIS